MNIEHRIMYSACRELFVERSIFITTERRVGSQLEERSPKQFHHSSIDIRHSSFPEVSYEVSATEVDPLDGSRS